MTLNKEFAQRLEECMKKANITNKKITDDLNLNKNAIGNCKKGQIPYAETLLEISNYLGTSIEYLLSGKSAAELTEEENRLIELYRQADDRGKKVIMMNAELVNPSQEQQSSDSKIG